MPQLEKLIRSRYEGITEVHGINRGAVLEAIAYVESSFGLFKDCGRYESAYGRRGVYYNGLLHHKYGDFAAMSYGTWQIMFPVAYELGYRNHPWLLVQDAVSIEWAIKYINVRAIARGAQHPEQIFDAYNSGSHRDAVVPCSYISKAMSRYNQCQHRYLTLREDTRA